MEGKGFDFAAIPQTAVKVLTSPAEFFKGMPKTGGFVEPLVFMIVMGVVGGLLQSILSLLRFRAAVGMMMGVGSVIVLPILIAIFGFVGAAILYVIWKLIGSQESYETAYRCGAYIGVLTPISVLLNLLPIVGGVVNILLMTFFLVTASVAVHNIPSRKAWMVFGIIGGLLILFSVSAEFAARRIGREAAKFQKEAEEAAKAMQKQTEQFQKQAEQIQKSAEQTSKAMEKQAEEASKLVEKQMEEAKKAMEQMQRGAPKEGK